MGAGHGLADVVKRPTRSASEPSREEIQQGLAALRQKIKARRPGLILFAFKRAARAVTGNADVPTAEGPAFEGVPTFLLSGPYARRDLAERVNEKLRRRVRATRGHDAEIAET